MRVIHFPFPAADALTAFDATGASFLPLADAGDTHISCLHLEMGSKVESPSLSHATALLIVHGRVTIEQAPGPRIKFSWAQCLSRTNPTPSNPTPAPSLL